MAGVRKFHRDVYLPRQAIYERAATTKQEPHTLFITCADSRIDPEALTQADPGDIFVTRNVGNLVPAYGEMVGGVSAVVEYAVTALAVSHIVVCGHTDCGAMKALLAPEDLKPMPTVRTWLRNAQTALSIVQATEPDAGSDDVLGRLTEQNVLLQMAHLRTHPSVAAGLARGVLEVHGWVYDIARGYVRIYEEPSRAFLTLTDLDSE